MVGSITASCGHVLTDEEGTGIPVIYGGEDCGSDGFRACLFYANFCTKCEAKWRAEGHLFASEADADAWLDAQRRCKAYAGRR